MDWERGDWERDWLREARCPLCSRLSMGGTLRDIFVLLGNEKYLFLGKERVCLSCAENPPAGVRLYEPGP